MPGGKTSSVPRAAGTAGVSLDTVTEGARGGARFLSHLLNAATSPGWPKRQTPSLPHTHRLILPPWGTNASDPTATPESVQGPHRRELPEVTSGGTGRAPFFPTIEAPRKQGCAVLPPIEAFGSMTRHPHCTGQGQATTESGPASPAQPGRAFAGHLPVENKGVTRHLLPHSLTETAVDHPAKSQRPSTVAQWHAPAQESQGVSGPAPGWAS